VPTVLPAGQVEAAPLPDFDAEFPSPDLIDAVRRSMRGDQWPDASRRIDGRESRIDDRRSTFEHRPSMKRPCRADRLLLEAQGLFEKARERAHEAERRSEEIEREAYLKGFQEGEKAGLEMGQAKLAPLLRDLDTLLTQIAEARTEVVRANQDQLVELATAIALRILHRELEQTPDQILHTVEEALALVGREERVRLRLSQADFQHLIDHRGDLPALAHLGDRVTLEVDPSMVRGGCLVQTSTGMIDATIETMFTEMRQTLNRGSRVEDRPSTIDDRR
jgi:flagellar assembly protein FliH